MSGVTAPFGYFDPMGLTPETNEELQLYARPSSRTRASP